MKKTVFGLLVLSLLGVFGCSWLVPMPGQEGYVKIVIHKSALAPESFDPAYIPANAEYVRVRVWHKVTGVNVVETAQFLGDTATIELRIPANTGYTVDAVAYVVTGFPAYGFLLTGGRLKNVDVLAGQTTQANLMLDVWSATFSGDTQITSGEVYSVTAQISHKDGMFDFFRTGAAFLLASLNSYQTLSATLPAPVATGTISQGKITISATAPDVDTQSTLYCSIFAQLRDEWRDPDVTGYVLVLEIPNRQLGERLHEIIVNPPEGGIIIGISQKEDE